MEDAVAVLKCVVDLSTDPVKGSGGNPTEASRHVENDNGVGFVLHLP